MPRRPKKPCAFHFCKELVEAGQRFCEEHRKAQQRKQDSARPTAAQRGYGSRWSRYRAIYLRDSPLCVECKKSGRIEPATVVDHIEPADGPDDPKFWDKENHQSLCASCHSRKTAREDGGFGRGI